MIVKSLVQARKFMIKKRAYLPVNLLFLLYFLRSDEYDFQQTMGITASIVPLADICHSPRRIIHILVMIGEVSAPLSMTQSPSPPVKTSLFITLE